MKLLNFIARICITLLQHTHAKRHKHDNTRLHHLGSKRTLHPKEQSDSRGNTTKFTNYKQSDLLKNADLVIIHIPKTAGTSLVRDGKTLARKTKPKLKVFQAERCFGLLFDGAKQSAFIVTALRQPRAHVLSQYLECGFDHWGKKVTKNTNFPRSTGNFMGGFVDWVHHFYVRGEAGTWGGENDFKCYNPINHQTRQLSCVGAHAFGLESHHVFADAAPRTIEEATKNMRKLNALVITELYAESLCLVEYKLLGQLPASCTCDLMSTRHVSHVSHHVPPHSIADIPAKTLKEIDAITKKDQAVYFQGLKYFLLDIEAVEVATNRTILCPSKKTSVFESMPSLASQETNMGGSR